MVMAAQDDESFLFVTKPQAYVAQLALNPGPEILWSQAPQTLHCAKQVVF